jgi:CheY-like chemotaxis protein
VSSEILVVEDNPDCRADIRWALEQAVPTCQVWEAENEIEAQRLIEDHRFAIVIADINLDEGGGSEFGGLSVLEASQSGAGPKAAVILKTAHGGKLAVLQEKAGKEPRPAHEYVTALGAVAYIDTAQPGVYYLDVIRAKAFEIIHCQVAAGETGGLG